MVSFGSNLGRAMVGHKWFGKRDVDVLNVATWAQHDPTKSWSDGNAVRGKITTAAQSLIADLERVVAENVSSAVAEYAQSAQAGLRAEGGEVFIGIRLHNDEAAMIIEVPLRRLVIDALSEMRPNLTMDREAQGALSGLVALGQALVGLVKPDPAAGVGHNSMAGTPPQISSGFAGRRVVS